MPQHTNALAEETSPYLLQHAHNPVDWNPWGEAALAQAQAEDKLLIISVGYAACHWCHVMERESFEDTIVAAAMNEGYVSIKVDREERPDIDDVYMTACHLSSGGSCGWPLNAIALPDGRPVWAGTYFPKKKWLEVLSYFVQLRETEPEKLEAYATQIANSLRNAAAQPLPPAEASFAPSVPEGAASTTSQLADLVRGGVGGAPKFPMPIVYDFLLNQYAFTGREEHLPVVHTTLEQMGRGGIYDQLGGGFARYSVDADWHAPHFEKMLYDNGQLVSLYSKAFRATRRPEYADVVRESLKFIERELTSPEGGFYSSLDADSEGEEGRFYVWTYEELDQALTRQELSVFATVYGITKRGNWEHGVNILHRSGSWLALAQELGLAEDELEVSIASAKTKLFALRAERVRPGLDDKILVSWNGLMLRGYVDAYLALADTRYLQAAQRNADYLLSSFKQADGRLLRTGAKGKVHINAFLDDYANLISGLLALYQAAFDERYLQEAQHLTEYTLEHFSQAEGALLYFTSDLDPALVARRIEDADNVIPASNSVMADNLLTLGSLLAEDRYIERAEAMVATIAPSLEQARQPVYWSNWLRVYERLARPRYEVAVVGEHAQQRRLDLARHLLPQAVFVGAFTEHTSTLALLEAKGVAGTTQLYVCENRVCQLPTEEVDQAVKQLTASRRSQAH